MVPIMGGSGVTHKPSRGRAVWSKTGVSGARYINRDKYQSNLLTSPFNETTPKHCMVEMVRSKPCFSYPFHQRNLLVNFIYKPHAPTSKQLLPVTFQCLEVMSKNLARLRPLDFAMSSNQYDNPQ
eukprot:TRINITY_DN23483_c0_g1_i1.p1 TRINITY_DN23483_c0_g1~~TRINITY_DN23483_c0_g1_i1.p1  ORF type:complete len:125 (+),score=8.39 TRINITY_DN23483_c0_g1_i1:605-979(+)